MKMLKLMLHCGGAEVPLSSIAAVKTPEATATHFPLAHSTFIDKVREGLAVANLEVVSEAHALAKAGQRYFGLLQVARKELEVGRDYSFVVGLRNAHDKMFPVGMVAGAGVFVCDNLSFSGEVDVFRKHTVFLERDLPERIVTAIAGLNNLWVSQDRRFEAYKGTEIARNSDLNDLLIRAWKAEATPISYIPHVWNEYVNPRHEEFRARTAWSLFNSFTEVLKKTSIHELPYRTEKLHLLMDEFCGISVRRS